MMVSKLTASYLKRTANNIRRQANTLPFNDYYRGMATVSLLEDLATNALVRERNERKKGP